ncbi:deoxyuridine 5'-triphosphate nucleotidohydrolase [Faustovirus]|nr:deoxyuridine 5'-triphosphate nucleotidohydrolase [Faustovirus]AMN84464.1 deoxyuridine 5'-triphosphate nucleotidohydrolase [Faustovirus]AMP44394.1 deoxyuridine 5'-triphosphate nucleotidohydrolase [Faustovirus]
MAFNLASIVLARVRLGILNEPVENTGWSQMVDDAVAGRKIKIASEDKETNASLNDLFAMKFVKLREDAVIPSKATDGSVGFDLTLLGIKSTCAEDDTVIYCHTGLKVKPPPGYYTKIYPRSSICKSGFVLANSVGIIDVDYRGELLVALKRTLAGATLTFPCKMAQIMPELDHSHIVSIEVETLDDTVRGEGGFGSTGK